jgi:hypothetical protein
MVANLLPFAFMLTFDFVETVRVFCMLTPLSLLQILQKGCLPLLCCLNQSSGYLFPHLLQNTSPSLDNEISLGTNSGWGGGIRTPECQDQNLVPYHLATPQNVPVAHFVDTNEVSMCDQYRL